MKFSDDGNLIAAAIWQTGDNKYQVGIAILDVASGKTVKHIKKTGAGQNLGQMQFTTDNRSLFYAGHGVFGINEIKLLSTEQNSESKFPKSPAISVVIHPENQSFAACTSTGDVNRFDFSSGEILNSISSSNPRNLLLSKTGSDLLITPSYGQQLFGRFDYESGKLKKTYHLQSSSSVVSHLRELMTTGSLNQIQSQSYPISVAWSTDGNEVISVALEVSYRPIGGPLGGEFDQQNIFLFGQHDSESGRVVGRQKFHPRQFGLNDDEWANLGAVSHNGKLFAVGNFDSLWVVDAESGETRLEITSQPHGQILAAEFSPDDRYLVTTMSTIVIVRDAETGEIVTELAPEKRRGRLISAFSTAGNRFVVCDSDKDGSVQIYSTDDWQPVFERSVTQHGRKSVTVSDDGQLIVFGLTDCRLEIWDRARLGSKPLKIDW